MSTLASTIAQEIGLLSRLIALLREEQAALQAGMADALPRIVQGKAAIIDELNQAAGQRNSFLGSMGFEPDKAGMAAWLRQNPTEKAIDLAWTQLLKIAEEARQLHLQNGDLIQLRLQSTQETLAVLNREVQRTALYGRDGHSATPATYRIIDSA